MPKPSSFASLWQPREMTLDAIQLRVLGSLIEKEITTPENYPLSLNSLISASNQRSSRDPVMDLTEDEVRQAVHSLEDLDILSPVRDSRVPKYEHRIRTVLNLRRDETAVLCLLLLRGPQTPGELRSRADRMYSFDDIGAVQSTLERMANRGTTANSEVNGSDAAGTSADAAGSSVQSLVVMLTRQPGSRESRYAHLLGGPIAATERTRPTLEARNHQAQSGFSLGNGSMQMADRIEALETSLKQLQNRIEELEAGKRES